MNFSDLMISIVSGKSHSFTDALANVAFSEFGIKIPLCYGISITIYAPNKAYEWCRDDIDKYMITKLQDYGGSIPVNIDWMDFSIANMELYFNKELGLVAIIQLDMEGLDKLVGKGIDTGNPVSMIFNQLRSSQDADLKKIYKVSDKGLKEFYKMEEMLCNVVQKDYGVKFTPVIWELMQPYFNNWYYSGMLRRGR